MDEFLRKSAQTGTLMGRYQINEKTNTIIFTNTNLIIIGKIVIGQDEVATVSRNPQFVRIEYGAAEIFLVPAQDQYNGTFTAGIMEVILKGDTKTLVAEITAALNSIMKPGA